MAQSERAEDSKQKDLIQGLKEEKVELLNQIKAMERDLIDHKDRVTVLQVNELIKNEIYPLPINLCC